MNLRKLKNGSNYHKAWQENRINFIRNKYGEDFFNGKKVLELASCNGRIGNFFHEAGADVLCLEGRRENIEVIKEVYPDLTCELTNLDRPDWPWGQWDIIVNFGILYHLEHYHTEFLINCLDNNCNLLFLETIVIDRPEPKLFFREEEGFDQSLSGRAGYPTTSFVENIFDHAYGKTYTRYDLEELDGGGHYYSWKPTNDGSMQAANRRFWIVQ